MRDHIISAVSETSSLDHRRRHSSTYTYQHCDLAAVSPGDVMCHAVESCGPLQGRKEEWPDLRRHVYDVFGGVENMSFVFHRDINTKILFGSSSHHQ